MILNAGTSGLVPKRQVEKAYHMLAKNKREREKAMWRPILTNQVNQFYCQPLDKRKEIFNSISTATVYEALLVTLVTTNIFDTLFKIKG